MQKPPFDKYMPNNDEILNMMPNTAYIVAQEKCQLDQFILIFGDWQMLDIVFCTVYQIQPSTNMVVDFTINKRHPLATHNSLDCMWRSIYMTVHFTSNRIRMRQAGSDLFSLRTMYFSKLGNFH